MGRVRLFGMVGVVIVWVVSVRVAVGGIAIGGTAVAAADSPPSGASLPYLATVTVPEVKLRAGPSDQFPETGTLTAGMVVLVDHEEPNGWLAVSDPPQVLRSVSWVPMQYITYDKNAPIPQNVVVDEGGAPLRAGRLGLAQPLPVQRTRVPGGTILVVIGPGVQFEGRTWYPVAPPPGDFRYLPKSAVRAEAARPAAFVVREPAPQAAGGAAESASVTPAASGTLPATPGTTAGSASRGSAPTGSAPTGSASTGIAPAAWQADPLWQQAEAAEKAGRLEEAERLYFELARRLNEPGGDRNLANLCYTRIHMLREKRRGVSGGASADPFRPTSPAAPGSAGPSASGRALGPPIPVTAPVTSGEARDATPRWHGPGRLVRSAIALDGRKTYALEANPGIPIVYVVAGSGVDLDRYVNSYVDVYGVSQTRNGLSRPYVVATAVEPVRK